MRLDAQSSTETASNSGRLTREAARGDHADGLKRRRRKNLCDTPGAPQEP